jgi:hypothetical protein
MLAWFDNIYDTILLIYCLDCLLFVCSFALFVRPQLPRSRPQLPNKPYAISVRYVVALIGVVQTLCYIGAIRMRTLIGVVVQTLCHIGALRGSIDWCCSNPMLYRCVTWSH